VRGTTYGLPNGDGPTVTHEETPAPPTPHVVCVNGIGDVPEVCSPI
jgi:hypothetical protein